MPDQSNLHLGLIQDNHQLREQKQTILDLFEDSYGRTLDEEIWDWAYLHNPTGPAVVCLAEDGHRVAAHYAVIPQPYASESVQGTYYLSMTTMVHPDFRRMGLFSRMADAVYRRIAGSGALGVLGFPNQNSLPGFKNKLSWTTREDLAVASLPIDRAPVSEDRPDVAEIRGEQAAHLLKPRKRLAPNLASEQYFAWRLSKPGATYHCLQIGDDLTILKEFDQTVDLVYVSRPGSSLRSAAAEWARDRGYTHINSLQVLSTLAELGAESTQPYFFGYRSAASHPDIEVHLIMSDVF